MYVTCIKELLQRVLVPDIVVEEKKEDILFVKRSNFVVLDSKVCSLFSLFLVILNISTLFSKLVLPMYSQHFEFILEIQKIKNLSPLIYVLLCLALHR